MDLGHLLVSVHIFRGPVDGVVLAVLQLRLPVLSPGSSLIFGHCVVL